MFADKIWPIISLLLYIFNFVVAIYISLQLIYHKRDPLTTLSWTIVLLFLPFVGLVFYFIFGRNLRKTHIFTRKGIKEERIKKQISTQQINAFTSGDTRLIPELLSDMSKLVLLNLNNGKNVLTTHNRVRCFFNGKDALEAMFASADRAKEHIHLQSYIVDNDAQGTHWKNLLMRKAQEGVKVRVIYDAFGCLHLPKSFLSDLRHAGVKIEAFSPVHFPFFSSRVNYRNHRKLLIVDGTTGYLGGVNIADRYYNGGDFCTWRDAHIQITGEAVDHLQSSFLMDWQFITERSIEKRSDLYMAANKKVDDVCYMQIISSGPDSNWAGIMQSFLTAINQAQKTIKVVTPYFIPTESLLEALRIAALGGIDVKILIPEKSDSKFTHWCTLSYISELLDAGVKVYLFKKGFIHSKFMCIDNKFCLIGSANFDNRSFNHNFEIGAMIYNPDITAIFEEQFINDTVHSYLVNPRSWNQRSRNCKIKEAVGRLLSPLL